VVVDGDRVLLVRRGREPAYGLWSVPGGLVELGESLEQAVRREVAEETAISVQVLDLVMVLDRVIPDRNGRIEYHYVLVDFLCRYEEGEPCAGTDVIECAFVSLDRLGNLQLTPGTEGLIRQAWAQAHGISAPKYQPRL
jgi:mutator protein MutT